MSIKIRQATGVDGSIIGRLLRDLLAELSGAPAPDCSAERLARIAHDLLDSDALVWGLLALDDEGQALGVVMLNECAATYAGGAFGEITELYVIPEQRGSGAGAAMIQAAEAFGRQRGWPRMEVGAPDVPRWQTTVDFYLHRGFEEVGPRLRLTL